MADVILLPSAEAEYQAALAWYRGRSRRVADGFEAALDRATAAIGANPGIGPRLDATHRFHHLRRYPYYLVYRIDPSQVTVVAVRHDRQKPRSWAGRP